MRSKEVLTYMQELFVRHYIANQGNATLAAQMAGYKGSKTQLNVVGSRLLSNVKVSNAIAKHKGDINQATQIDAVTVIRELSRVALVSVADLYDDKGDLIPIKKLPKHVAAAIASVEVVKHPVNDTVTTKVKLHSKLAALGDLCKHLGLYQADKIPAENLRAKELDAQTSRNVLDAINATYSQRYLAKPVDSIEINQDQSQCKDMTSQAIDDLFPDTETIEEDFPDETPITPHDAPP